jgi:hypothetical protein
VLRSIVIAITLSLVLAGPAFAQTQAQAAKLERFMEVETKELGQRIENLLGMITGMDDTQSVAAIRIYDALAGTDQKSFTQLYVVVSIYTLMKDSRDQATVKKYVGILAGGAVGQSNAAIALVNRDLVKLSSTAAIAEVQKARDLILKIRDEIQRTVPGS